MSITGTAKKVGARPERVDAGPDQARHQCEAEQAQEQVAELAVCRSPTAPRPQSQSPDRCQNHSRGRLERGELPGPGPRARHAPSSR